MRNLLSLFLIIALTVPASAQKVYYVFLQTDDSRTFYLRLGDKIYSSTSSGYLILSNLVDSTYSFSVGFSSSQSQSKFKIELKAKDRGFVVKNFNDGLELFDLQELSIIKPENDGETKNISYQKRDDHFATLLSKAANDTSLLYTVVTVKQDVALKAPVTDDETKVNFEDTQPKNEEVLVTTDTVAVVPPIVDIENKDKKTVDAADRKEDIESVVNSGATNQNIHSSTTKVSTQKNDATPTDISVVAPEPFKRSQVKKHSESSTSEGFGLVFYDNDGQEKDTIRLLIPNPKFVIASNLSDTFQEETKLIQVDANTTEKLSQNKIVVSAPKGYANSNCKSTASESDFFKLRKNMAGKHTDEGMVDEAKKVFKNKCFSTEQIRNLSALFLTSAGKYQFFDAAYFYVTDRDNFSVLQSEIKDDYYLKRFKAMIGD